MSHIYRSRSTEAALVGCRRNAIDGQSCILITLSRQGSRCVCAPLDVTTMSQNGAICFGSPCRDKAVGVVKTEVNDEEASKWSDATRGVAAK